MRVLVVGSGLAGLEAALTAFECGHDVTILTKASVTDSATAWAQGGVAAALGSDDSPALHAADTMRASANLAEPRAVDVLATEGPGLVRELAGRGAKFDLDDAGNFARAREAAHSLARVVHAGGDATGAEIERALVAAVHKLVPVERSLQGEVGTQRPAIRIVEHHAISDLLLERGRVIGVRTIDGNGTVTDWPADAVILATGGAGQVYRYTTNPAVATGDGLAAAIRAGAQLADLEFVQFHPTALAATEVALISEAVRGDGAVLRNAAGERFMLTVHADAELAPRDVVARAVAREMARDSQPVWLDATAIRPEAENAAYLAERFPTIDAIVHRHGIDWATEWVPITPAAHYVMGGIETDLDGRTSIPGLWAVGEVARTGVHGANRLASNSLLEAGVFAHRAARSLADYTPAPPRSLSGASEASAIETQQHSVRSELQTLMWNNAGLERNAASLRDAAERISNWLAATSEPRTFRELEDRNLLTVAQAIVQAALERGESVGAHYRTDDTSTGTIAVQEPQHA